MIYGLQRTSAPASTPVTLAEAKAHLRIEHSLEDPLITSLLEAATEWSEDYQQKAYITQTWTLTLDRFPAGEIAVFRPPLQSVTTIKYDDVDNVNQTLAASTYVVDTSSDQGGRIALAFNQSWPDTYNEIGSVVVTFVAGYGAPEDVSQQIKAAIKLLLSHWYEHRESVSEGPSMTEVPMAVTSLLGPRSVVVAG